MLSTILLWMSTAFVLCGHPVTFFSAPSNEKDLPVVQHGVLEKMTVILDKSIAKYPFEVHGHLDCDQIRFYTLKKDNRSYLFIESIPSSWTGLMSAKFSFYQLVAINEKLGVQTIATAY